MGKSGRNLAAAVACGLGLAACAATPPEVVDHTSLRTEIENSLAEAAGRAAAAQERLARVQVARTAPAPLPIDEASLPDELRRPSTLEWSGPAHEAAARIAALIGYRFAVVGNPPSIPPMIHVSLVDVPAAKALEQIGLQSFPFGEVALDPNARRVEFRYLRAQQQPRSAAGTSPSLAGPTK